VSLIAVAAGKDTRGVTTTALALAAVWPLARPVLVAECDPSGGSLAARFAMPANPGLMTLASAGRRHLSPDEVAAHTQVLGGGGLNALLGPLRAEEAHALGRVWPNLAAVLAQLDADVIADCGRHGPDSPADPVLRAADLVVLVCEPTREGVLHLQGRIDALAAQGLSPAVVLLGEEPYSAAAVKQALSMPANGTEVLGVLAHDPKAAALLAGRPGSPRQLSRSVLIRSARAVAGAINARLPTVDPSEGGPEAATEPGTPATVEAR
jgi:MinD-like ATPase involved in chromosome partitioning or flagellar assembly